MMSERQVSRQAKDGRLSHWLPALIGGVLIVVFAMGALVLFTLRQVLLAESGERLAVAATAVAEKLDRTLFERYGDSQVLARLVGWKRREPAALTAFLREFQDIYTFYDWIAVADAQGRIIAATDQASVGASVARAPWFRAARAAGSVQVSDVAAPGETLDWPAVTFVAPMIDTSGTFQGVVLTRLSLHRLEDVLNETAVSLVVQQGTAARLEYQLLRANGELLADSVLREEGRANLLTLGVRSAQAAAQKPAGYLEEPHGRRPLWVVTGYARTRGYETFPGLGWLVLIRVDRDNLLDPVTRLLWQVGLLGGTGLLPLLGLLWWITRQLRVGWQEALIQRDRAVAAR